MGFKVKGYAPIKANLDRVGGRVEKHSLDWLRTAAKIVANEAKMRTPVDTHDLEKAIKADDDPDVLGLNRRKTVRVYVDLDALDLEGSHAGFDYATWAHEASYNLGPLSQEKDALTPVGVGPKYLERALDENVPRLMRIIEEMTRKAIRQ